MSLLVVGVSHRSAPVSLLERLSVPSDAAPKLLHALLEREHIDGAMVLSTCNRVEVYADVTKFHGGVAEVSELLGEQADLGLDLLASHCYVHYEDSAVQHLFSVAAGLDSMVVGETQILGQLRSALRLAQEEDTVSGALDALAQQSLRVGKRVHSETGIDRAGASLVAVGLARALGQFGGSPEGLRAVVVGAGAMSSLTVATLARAGAAAIDVVSRTPENASRVAGSYAGRGGGLADLPARLAVADLLVSCTGAVGTVVGVGLVAAAMAGRPDRPLAVLDLALPRDVDPAVGDLPAVGLTDLESLQPLLESEQTSLDVALARTIVAEEVGGALAAQRSTRVAPTVVALRTKAAEVVEVELARLDARMPGLDRGARAELATTVRRVVEKLLHTPTVRVKQLAETPGGQSYAEALGELFGLDLAAVEAVTRADVTLEDES